MKPIQLKEEIRIFGSWKVVTKYYDNDDIYIELLDLETGELIAYIETDEETDLGINWN